MPVFKYKGLTTAGKTVSGIRDSDSPRTLRAVLKKDGVFLTDVTEQRSARATSKGGQPAARRFGQRVSAQELGVTTRQLATLLNAGVTLVESLTAMVDQSENDYLKLVLSQVKQRVNEGSSLADAMARHQVDPRDSGRDPEISNP